MNTPPSPPPAHPRIDADLVERFLDARTGARPRTITAYRCALQLAIGWELPLDDDALKAFDYGLSKRSYSRRIKDGGRVKTVKGRYSATTRQLYVTSLKQFLYWLEAEDLAPAGFNLARCAGKLQASRGKRARAPYQHRSPDQELMAIVEHLDQSPAPSPHARDSQRLTLELLRNRALVHTLRCSGGRIAEVLGLKRFQVQDGRKDEALILGKGGKQRVLFLDRPALSAIARYCGERNDQFEPLFISHRRGLGQALTPSSAWQIVKRVARALGLRGLASPHMFRHHLAEDMLRSGAPLESVQAVLGHADIGTTRKVYAPADVDQAREAMRRYRGARLVNGR
jgi:site-specific recombinase XerD